MNRITVGVALVILLVAGLTGHFEYEDEQIEQDQYCDMVAIWKADGQAGIPKSQRKGWPPFNGDKFCPATGENR